MQKSLKAISHKKKKKIHLTCKFFLLLGYIYSVQRVEEFDETHTHKRIIKSARTIPRNQRLHPPSILTVGSLVPQQQHLHFQSSHTDWVVENCGCIYICALHLRATIKNACKHRVYTKRSLCSRRDPLPPPSPHIYRVNNICLHISKREMIT